MRASVLEVSNLSPNRFYYCFCKNPPQKLTKAANRFWSTVAAAKAPNPPMPCFTPSTNMESLQGLGCHASEGTRVGLEGSGVGTVPWLLMAKCVLGQLN